MKQREKKFSLLEWLHTRGQQSPRFSLNRLFVSYSLLCALLSLSLLMDTERDSLLPPCGKCVTSYGPLVALSFCSISSCCHCVPIYSCSSYPSRDPFFLGFYLRASVIIHLIWEWTSVHNKRVLPFFNPPSPTCSVSRLTPHPPFHFRFLPERTIFVRPVLGADHCFHFNFTCIFCRVSGGAQNNFCVLFQGPPVFLQVK